MVSCRKKKRFKTKLKRNRIIYFVDSKFSLHKSIFWEQDCFILCLQQMNVHNETFQVELFPQNKKFMLFSVITEPTAWKKTFGLYRRWSKIHKQKRKLCNLDAFPHTFYQTTTCIKTLVHPVSFLEVDCVLNLIKGRTLKQHNNKCCLFEPYWFHVTEWSWKTVVITEIGYALKVWQQTKSYSLIPAEL